MNICTVNRDTGRIVEIGGQPWPITEAAAMRLAADNDMLREALAALLTEHRGLGESLLLCCMTAEQAIRWRGSVDAAEAVCRLAAGQKAEAPAVARTAGAS